MPRDDPRILEVCKSSYASAAKSHAKKPLIPNDFKPQRQYSRPQRSPIPKKNLLISNDFKLQQ
jgi:hypothetical protein